MRIVTALMPGITIARFRRMRDVVDLAPPYQREGGIWTPGTQGRLIDSIVNGLDLPKLYFEKLSSRRVGPSGLSYQYAVIDGKQRLEAIEKFLQGELTLPDDFKFFEDEAVKAAGLTLPELEARYPKIVQRLLDFELPIVLVSTDSGDLIEEMFQRLNAASALNAAERRNSISGATKNSANALAGHELLVLRSPIKNARYKYRELASKFLAIEHQLDTKQRVQDTKADTLYRLFLATHGDGATITEAQMAAYEDASRLTLDRMLDVFVENDPLLASIGTVVVFYIMFRDETVAASVSRDRLQLFESLRRQALQMAESEDEYARGGNARLREYSVLVQSTNDGKALERRARILTCFMTTPPDADPLAGLDDLGDAEDVPDSEADG